MKRRNKSFRKQAHFNWPRPSPPFVVGAVAVLTGLLLLTAPTLKSFFSDHLTPRISFEQGGVQRKREGAQNQRPTTTTIFDGEVYRTEGRLREASAVAIAASLSAVASLSEQRPVRYVSELLQDLVRRGLLPPGVELDAERNRLLSEHSTIYVRLRTEPLGVEILSLARERLDGPALLLRVPDDRRNKYEPARYFYSLKLKDIRVPDAFATPPAVLACGWQMDTIQPAIPAGANEDYLATWAGEQQTK